VTCPPFDGLIRDAAESDAASCAGIYAPYVAHTAVSFELDPPDAQDMASRISAAQRQHAWLVAERDGQVVGYAYGRPFRTRPAYQWACETSVYVAAQRRRCGVGTALYDALLDRLAGRGLQQATAGLTLPNEASLALHESVGFARVGVFHAVGWKLGRWHDVLWMQRPLVADGGSGSAVDEPPPALR
jgi:phosphinothricin acetyltransferase